ncbi:MAG TPA: oligosaccharide flippase family protein [Flavobacterium sp.]|nr:oligosaccharide flippase family protein [Flavobacterium sp.]
MGIVIKQSIRNTVITYIGFAIGAANALFMYTNFLGKTYYGLTAFLLSSANIMMPLMAFGVHNTLVKFYSGYKTEKEKSEFLSFMMLLPLLLVVPFSLIAYFFYSDIAAFLSRENPIIYHYVWLIPLISLCMGYFEIFYAWVKVHMKSVFGNFIKEVFLRILISIFLYAVYFKWITAIEFVYITVGIYFVMTLAMVYFALRVKMPAFSLKFPSDKKAVFIYSIFIIISGSVATLLIDIDKFMLGQYINIDNVAYYSVAIFIATVISVPSRAMHQIVYPITAKLMAENKHDELNILYKKTSISLQIVGGYVLLGILVNIKALYMLLPPEYAGGIFVVFTIGISKYFDLILGNNNAIIFNSIYYRMVLFLGLLLAFLAVTLNMFFIPRYGIDGAAIATLIAITLYSLSKLFFVTMRMKLQPFTRQTLYSLAISLAIFFAFYYWEFPFHPLPNIILKSILMSVVYGYLNYKLRISAEVNQVIEKVFPKFKSL